MIAAIVTFLGVVLETVVTMSMPIMTHLAFHNPT